MKERVQIAETYYKSGDEARFSLGDYINKQNCRIWGTGNPEVIVEKPLQSEKAKGRDNMCISVNLNSTTDNNADIEYEEILPQAPDHCVASFAVFNQMRANSQLCDITLDVNGETLDAHKVVLASTSPYFYAMFNGDMLEHTLGIVRIYDIDLVSLTHLIDYIYTGELSITEQNVRGLLPASGLLELQLVLNACCAFLLRRLHPSNCLEIRRFADTYSCKKLYTGCHEYVLQNFESVVETEDFLLLPFGEVRDLISDNFPNDCSEETRAHTILIWIKHDLHQRQKHIVELMSHVRMHSLNRNFLMTRMMAEPLIRDDPQCKDLLVEVMKDILRSVMGSQRTQEPRPDDMKPYVFAVGGIDGTVLNKCEVYNPRSNAWSTIASMLSRRYAAGVTTLQKTLYVVGGHDGVNDLNTAESYNPLTNKWSYITRMSTKRSGLGTCALEGMIYVCGGYDGASLLSSTERYDPLTDIWNSCPPMNTQRKFCRLTVLDNCIYCCGGLDSSDNRLSNVERFDPRIGRWYAVPSMKSRRSSCGVAAYDGFLYCIGGYDGNKSTSSGERFNLRTNTWETIANMHLRRLAHGLVEVEGCLYALGGYDGSSPLKSVERYDIQLNKWTIVNSMDAGRGHFGAAVLDCFDLERSLV